MGGVEPHSSGLGGGTGAHRDFCGRDRKEARHDGVLQTPSWGGGRRIEKCHDSDRQRRLSESTNVGEHYHIVILQPKCGFFLAVTLPWLMDHENVGC